MDGKNISLLGKEHYRGNMPQLELFNRETMKFTIQQKDLLTALSITGKAIKNSVIPLLECSRLQIKDNECIITGSNFEFFIIRNTVCKSEIELDICIDNRKLVTYLKELADQPLSFEATLLDDKGNYIIKITSSKGHCKLPGFDGKDYAVTPIVEGIEIEAETASFNNAILRTTFATHTDDSHVAFSSLIEFGEGITTISADGRLIAIKKISDVVSESKQCLVKPFILNTIATFDFTDKVKLSYSEQYLKLDYTDTVVYARLSEGIYPNCKAMSPKDNGLLLTVKVSELKSAIRRVLIFSNKISNHISFSLSQNELTIKADDVDLNEEGLEVLECDYNGGDFKICFLGSQMLSILDNLQSETCMFFLKDERTVAMVKEFADSEDLYLNVPSVLHS